jgi:hypothetical protein
MDTSGVTIPRSTEPVLPAVPVSELQSRRFCVSQQERFEWMLEHANGASDGARVSEVFACRNGDGEAVVTVDTPFSVAVRELRYPGRAARDSVPVDGKWLYVFRDGSLYAEARAIAPDQWVGKTHAGAGHSWQSTGGIRLEPRNGNQPARYAFFLSPVELTPSAIQYLQDAGLDFTTVSVACQGWGTEVLVPDPYAWAADAHRLYYLRALRRYADLTDSEMEARIQVAAQLKAWADAGDPYGISNELDMTPDAFAEDLRKAREAELRTAEEAAAYVAHCVDSHERQAIDLACMERGEVALSICYQAWCAVTEALHQTVAGRTLARRVATDPERFPRRYLFTKNAPSNALEFKHYRWSWLAAVALFEDLWPDFADWLRSERVAPEQAVLQYLDNVALKGKRLREPKNFIRDNLAKGKPVGHGLGKKKAKRAQKVYDKLVELDEIANARDFPANHAKIGKTLDKLHRDLEPVMKSLNLSLGSFFELINLANAVADLRKASGAERGTKTWSLVGAGADATEHALSCIASAMAKGAAKRAVLGVAGFANIVGSYADAIEFSDDTHAAIAEYDYARAASHGVQVVGATLGAVGGVLLLSKAVGASTAGWVAGPWGAGLVFAGSLLVIGGGVAASLLRHNVFETFASRCFLGSGYGISDGKVTWSHRKLAHGPPTTEFAVMLHLLANYRVSWGRLGRDMCLHVEPGFLRDDSEFEVTVLRGGTRELPHVWRFRVVFDPEDVVILQPGAKLELKPGSRIERDDDGNIVRISINVEPLIPPAPVIPTAMHHGAPTNDVHYLAGVRLVLDPKSPTTVPHRADQVVRIGSRDEFVTSLDEDRWADLTGLPA